MCSRSGGASAAADFAAGLARLEQEDEPTLILFPQAADRLMNFRQDAIKQLESEIMNPQPIPPQGQQPQGQQRLLGQHALIGKPVTRCAQIEVVDIHVRDRQLVKDDTLGRAAQLGNQLPVRLPAAGTKPHIDAMFRPFSLQIMGPPANGKHLDDQDALALMGGQFDIRHQAGACPTLIAPFIWLSISD